LDYTSHGQTTRNIDPLQVEKNSLDLSHFNFQEIEGAFTDDTKLITVIDVINGLEGLA